MQISVVVESKLHSDSARHIIEVGMDVLNQM